MQRSVFHSMSLNPKNPEIVHYFLQTFFKETDPHLSLQVTDFDFLLDHNFSTGNTKQNDLDKSDLNNLSVSLVI